MTTIAALTDELLLAEVARRAARERDATAALIESLAELDRRQLYLGAGYSSLFAYCTRALRLSEHAAYGRIEAARASRRFPVILEMLASGSLTLTAVCLLAPHLTDGNHATVLTSARHKSKREIEHLVAELRPRPDVPASVRKLPAPDRSSTPTPAARNIFATEACEPDRPPAATPVPDRPRARPIAAPLSPDRYRIQFTVNRATYDKLQHAIALMRHRVPDGDVGVIFERALTLLIADAERSKCGATKARQPGGTARLDTRRIPAAVRRAVWDRDGGQCAFVGTGGRCTERAFLEFHHIRPFADGGLTEVDNLSLRCRAHNQYEADLYFGAGPLFVREVRSSYMLARHSVRTESPVRARRRPPISPSQRQYSARNS